ncbi:hypothetical protein ACJMK2_009684 [Sinanodonta woodiana]|uniref:Uncharacterized protein n=1 Tax=Sinanodonta woodiana TaxID=1069815 RepID=A0ABD3VD13_SINWO
METKHHTHDAKSEDEVYSIYHSGLNYPLIPLHHCSQCIIYNPYTGFRDRDHFGDSLLQLYLRTLLICGAFHLRDHGPLYTHGVMDLAIPMEVVLWHMSQHSLIKWFPI